MVLNLKKPPGGGFFTDFIWYHYSAKRSKKSKAKVILKAASMGSYHCAVLSVFFYLFYMPAKPAFKKLHRKTRKTGLLPGIAM